MPTYQYLCRDCDHRFDTVQSIHDDALTVCPECGGTIRRVLHPVGVTFKGSGFYRTDSREKKSGTAPAPSGSKGGEAKAKEAATSSTGDASGASSGSSSTSGSSDAKAAPAAKPGGSASKE